MGDGNVVPFVDPSGDALEGKFDALEKVLSEHVASAPADVGEGDSSGASAHLLEGCGDRRLRGTLNPVARQAPTAWFELKATGCRRWLSSFLENLGECDDLRFGPSGDGATVTMLGDAIYYAVDVNFEDLRKIQRWIRDRLRLPKVDAGSNP